MARIFITGYDLDQENVKSIETNHKNFYYTLTSLLSDAGNDVLCVDCKWERNKKIPQNLVDRLKSFDPELCVILNYGFWDLTDYVDCKFIYCDIDSAQDVSLQTNYLIRNTIEKCLFLTTEYAEKERIEETFGIDDNKVRLINIPINNKFEEGVVPVKKYDLLYIGTNRVESAYKAYRELLSNGATESEIADTKKVLTLIDQDSKSTIQDEYNNILSFANNRLDSQSANKIRKDNNAIRKIKMLSSIVDLGLVIKGTNWNSNAMDYYPEVLKCVENFDQFDINKYIEECSTSKITLWFDDGQYAKGSYSRLIEAIQADTIVIAQKSTRSEKLIELLGLPSFVDENELIKVCKQYLSENAPIYSIDTIHQKVRDLYNGQDIVKIVKEFGELEFDVKTKKLQIIKEDNLTPNIVYVNSIDSSEEKPLEKANIIVVDKKSQISDFEQESRLIVFAKKAWNRLALFFGYDLKNIFPKEALKIWKFIIWENLHYSDTIDRIYLFSLPMLEIRKKEDGNHLHLAAFTQTIENFRKLFKFLKRKTNKKKSSCYSILRKKIKKGEKIKICLFVSRITCWIYTNLYKCLEESSFFEPIVVVKPFMFNGHDAMVDYMNTTYKILKERGYNVVKGYDESIGEFLDVRKVINPDIVFYTKYWKPQFQENFYIDKFEDKLTFYTSYCFDIAYHPEVMNFELNNKVDRYFMPTPIHKKMAQVTMDNHAENVYVVGAPKLDVFFDQSYVPQDVWKQQRKKKKRIIWAPHHSDNFPGNLYQFNAFYELTDFMFKMAEKYKDDIQIAFKPHPMLKPYLENKKWGKKSADAYYDKWANLDNGQLETGEFVDLFLTSDAMILDSISFIAEYTATNKPSLFTIGSKSRVQLNDFGSINFEVLYHTDNDLKADIEKFIVDVVINGNDTKKEERTEFINKYLLPPNGKSSAENIYDNIIDEIQNGDRKKK